jgi:predicted amidohydrolase YtcJ
MGTTVYRNAKVFTADPARPWSPAFAVRDGRFLVVGCDEEVDAAAASASETSASESSASESSASETSASDTSAGATSAGEIESVDLEGALVIPGVIDGHFHLLHTGGSLQRVDLLRAKSLDEIQGAVRNHANADVKSHWVLGKSWLFDAVPGEPTAAMLDPVVSQRPVLLDANDFHSTWVNSLALEALGITDETPDPAGGRIARDEHGKATGFLEETAAELAWDHLDKITTSDQRDHQLKDAVMALNAAGLTTVIDMGMGPVALETISHAEQRGDLDVRVVAHWLMSREGPVGTHLAQVSEAAALSRTHSSDLLRVAGIKFIVDGVIDGCTAHVTEPYTNGALPDPIWDYEALAPVVAAADKAGLQVALHAIGDAAVHAALDAVENAYRENGGDPRARRHRIEHIEYCDPADIPRFAQLNVTASMQPVHADPAIQDNWRQMLGPQRSPGGFPAAALAASGARLVLGTDAPTAPFAPLPNLFIATTRRSALQPELAANEPKNALPIEDALTCATANAAWSCFAEDRLGSISLGKHADFVVVDPDITESDPERLLNASVLQTVVGGRTVHRQG